METHARACVCLFVVVVAIFVWIYAPYVVFTLLFHHKLTSRLGEVTRRRFVASLYLVVGEFDKCVVLFG